MAFLEVIAGPQRGQRFALVPGSNVIGRDTGCEVALLDETASRRHAAIELQAGATLVDMGSANGTRLNGERVDRCALKEDDQIHLGQTVLRFHGDRERETVILGGDQRLSEVSRLERTEHVDRQRPGEAQGNYLSRLQSICRVAEQITALEAADELLQALATTLSREVGFQRGAIAVPGRRPLAFDGQGRLLGREVQLSSGLTERVRQGGQAVLFAGARDRELAERQSIVASGTTSALCVPLLHRGASIGLIYLDRTDDRALGSADLGLVADLAGQLGPALGRALEAEREDPERLVLVDPASLALLETIDRAAATPASVLLLGETGVGKERFARRIHQRSDRADGPFVALNMAALPETLVESELFGHEAGAFTGADRSSPGKFRLAHGGTLFLDEVGELHEQTQAKLLRALEAREFYPVGGSEPVRVDVRIVAATNQALAQAVAAGRFRQDLYYRLAVVELSIPPLRERPGDILPMARHFFEVLSRQLGRSAPRFDGAFEKALLGHGWPGNVREMRNVIERVLVLAGAGAVSADALPATFGDGSAASGAELPVMSLKEAERWAIVRALKYTGGKKGEAVKLLGTSWPTLNKKIKDYGIDLDAIKKDGP